MRGSRKEPRGPRLNADSHGMREEKLHVEHWSPRACILAHRACFLGHRACSACTAARPHAHAAQPAHPGLPHAHLSRRPSLHARTAAHVCLHARSQPAHGPALPLWPTPAPLSPPASAFYFLRSQPRRRTGAQRPGQPRNSLSSVCVRAEEPAPTSLSF